MKQYLFMQGRISKMSEDNHRNRWLFSVRDQFQ
jgi:hypothetical protein